MQCVRYACAAIVFAASTLVLGCSGEGDTADVSGVVKYDGKEVEDGGITFFPADGKGPSGGATIKNGKYTASKVPVGNTKVVITGSKVVGKKKVYDTPDSPERPITQELLPKKYSDKEKSELTFEVKRGANEKDWDLTK